MEIGNCQFLSLEPCSDTQEFTNKVQGRNILVEFSTYIFEKKLFSTAKMMNFLENDLQTHKKICKLVQIWFPDPYSKSPNTQNDPKNIMKIGIL